MFDSFGLVFGVLQDAKLGLGIIKLQPPSWRKDGFTIMVYRRLRVES